MKKIVYFFFCLNTVSNAFSQPGKTDLTAYVDPFIGTGFHGHVFLGANVPFGAVQLGPTNISRGWDWCSGYHYSDSTIIGFAHTHLSGTGIGDLGDISFMPVTGSVKPKKGILGNPSSGYYSLFSHKDEKVSPGYYRVKLKRYNVIAELTATTRTGFQQYRFPSASTPEIIIDLEEGISDNTTSAYITKVNDTTVSGYRFSRGWARDQRIYFTAVFSKPISSISVYEDTTLLQGSEAKGRRIKAMLSFSSAGNHVIMVKTGISPVSSENALANLRQEIPGWNFNQVAAEAKASWNRELSKVKIQSADKSRMRCF